MSIVKLQVVKALVLLTRGTDKVSLEIKVDVPAFPTMDYPTHISIETEPNHGESFCKINFGIKPEIISAR